MQLDFSDVELPHEDCHESCEKMASEVQSGYQKDVPTSKPSKRLKTPKVAELDGFDKVKETPPGKIVATRELDGVKTETVLWLDIADQYLSRPSKYPCRDSSASVPSKEIPRDDEDTGGKELMRYF
jgi:hypothetical protein